jgi:hypothetical protein
MSSLHKPCYHYLTINVVMRDCDSIEDAHNKCSILMPQFPDENTKSMESWEIIKNETMVVRSTQGPE